MPWFIDSDQLLKIEGLQDPTTLAYVNNATVRVTMKDSAGVEVVGQTWPLVLDYVIGSDGDYQGLLEDGRVMIEGALYWAELTADAGGDLIKKWRWSDVARHRVPADDA